MPLINGILVVKKDRVDSDVATASAANILFGKTAVVGKELITGTMKDNSGKLITGSFKSGGTKYIRGSIPEDGYYNKSSILQVPVTNLTASNIRNGINIGGVVGTYSGDLFSGEVVVKINRIRDSSATITGYSDLGKKIGLEYIISHKTDNSGWLVRKRSVTSSTQGTITEVGTYNSLSEIELNLTIDKGLITKPLYTSISVLNHTILWGNYSEDHNVFVI